MQSLDQLITHIFFTGLIPEIDSTVSGTIYRVKKNQIEISNWNKSSPYLEIPCSICPWSTHTKNHSEQKTMLVWKCGDHPTCTLPDNRPTGSQPPWPTPATKKQDHLCAQRPIPVLQKRRPTTHPCWATTSWAHQIGSASMLCFQYRKRYVYSQHDNQQFHLLMLHRGIKVTQIWLAVSLDYTVCISYKLVVVSSYFPWQ